MHAHTHPATAGYHNTAFIFLLLPVKNVLSAALNK